MYALSWLRNSAAAKKHLLQIALTTLLLSLTILFSFLSSPAERTPVTAATLADTARTCWPSRKVRRQEWLVEENLCAAPAADDEHHNPLHFFNVYEKHYAARRWRRHFLTCYAFCQDEEFELARYVVAYQLDIRRDIPYWKETMRHLASPLAPEETHNDPLNERSLFFDIDPFYAELQEEMESYLRTKAAVGMLPEEYKHVAKHWRDALHYKTLHPTPNATDPMLQLAARVEKQLETQPWLLQPRAVVAQATQLYERHVLRVVQTRSLQVSRAYAAAHASDLVTSVQQYILQLWELTAQRIHRDPHRARQLLPYLPALEGVPDFPYPRLKQPTPIVVTLHHTADCLLCDLYHQTFDMLPYLYQRMCTSAGHTIVECNPLVVFLRVPETRSIHVVPRISFRKGPRLYVGNVNASGYPGVLGAVLQSALEDEKDESDESDHSLGLLVYSLMQKSSSIMLSQNPTLLDLARAVMDSLVSVKAIRFRVLSDKQMREMHEHNARLDRKRKEEEHQRQMQQLMQQLKENGASHATAVLDPLTWFASTEELNKLFSLSSDGSPITSVKTPAPTFRKQQRNATVSTADTDTDGDGEAQAPKRSGGEQEMALDSEVDTDDEEEKKRMEKEYFKFTTVGEYLGGEVRRIMLLLAGNRSANLDAWPDYSSNEKDRFHRMREAQRLQGQLGRGTPLLLRVWAGIQSNLLLFFFLAVFLFQLVWNKTHGTSIW